MENHYQLRVGDRNMITKQAIIEWQENAPWTDMRQVEQDLIISRALTAIYSDDYLASRLAFRGGTALHRIYFSPPARYSDMYPILRTMWVFYVPYSNQLELMLADIRILTTSA